MRTRHAPFAFLAFLAPFLLTAVSCGEPRADPEPALESARPPFVLGAVEGPSRFAGVVEERVPAGGYLYLRVARDDGDAEWVASLNKPVVVGDRVEVRALATRSPFRSARLDRAFSSVTFGVVTPDDDAAASASRKES